MITERKTILIVEDEADLRDALSTAFSYEEFNVLTASDGEEGLRTALTKKPDLILLDVMMPKMTGIEVLKNLRTNEWGKQTKIIIMTSLDDLEKVAEAMEAGVDEYVVKTDITLNGIVTKVKEKLGVITAE